MTRADKWLEAFGDWWEGLNSNVLALLLVPALFIAFYLHYLYWTFSKKHHRMLRALDILADKKPYRPSWTWWPAGWDDEQKKSRRVQKTRILPHDSH